MCLREHPSRPLPTTKKLTLQPSRFPALARRHAHALSHVVHDSRLPAQFAHILDALTQLSEQGDQENIVGLREGLGGEGALFRGCEEGEV